METKSGCPTKLTRLSLMLRVRTGIGRNKKLIASKEADWSQQECSQSYSPVARWITEMALTLTGRCSPLLG